MRAWLCCCSSRPPLPAWPAVAWALSSAQLCTMLQLQPAWMLWPCCWLLALMPGPPLLSLLPSLCCMLPVTLLWPAAAAELQEALLLLLLLLLLAALQAAAAELALGTALWPAASAC